MAQNKRLSMPRMHAAHHHFSYAPSPYAHAAECVLCYRKQKRTYTFMHGKWVACSVLNFFFIVMKNRRCDLWRLLVSLWLIPANLRAIVLCYQLQLLSVVNRHIIAIQIVMNCYKINQISFEMLTYSNFFLSFILDYTQDSPEVLQAKCFKILGHDDDQYLPFEA